MAQIGRFGELSAAGAVYIHQMNRVNSRNSYAIMTDHYHRPGVIIIIIIIISLSNAVVLGLEWKVLALAKARPKL